MPFFVCGTVGTTSSNAMDPLPAIAPICRRTTYGSMWMRPCRALPRCVRNSAICKQGVEHADSYCFNPHKWMFTNFDCDCFYVADRKALIKTLSILPEYLQNQATESGAVFDYRDWQIPLGPPLSVAEAVVRNSPLRGRRTAVSRSPACRNWRKSLLSWVREMTAVRGGGARPAESGVLPLSRQRRE